MLGKEATVDDEVKRKIAASLDGPLDPRRDRDAIRALENDAQAQAWVAGLKTVEAALNRWPAPTRSESQWEDFAARLERCLDEEPEERSFDPFAAPVLGDDDGEAQNAEQTSMSQSPNNDDDDDDLGALAALTRSSSSPTTSMAPPPIKAGPSLHDDAMDESSGIVDMKQLAELALKQSVPPAASSLSPNTADTKTGADAAVMAGEKPTLRAVEAPTPGTKAAKSATTATTAKATTPIDARAAAPAAKKGPGVVVWLAPLIAAAAAGGFLFLKSEQREAPMESATRSEPPTESQQSGPSVPIAPAVPAVAPPPAPPATEQPVAVAAPAAALIPSPAQEVLPEAARPTVEVPALPPPVVAQNDQAHARETVGSAAANTAPAGHTGVVATAEETTTGHASDRHAHGHPALAMNEPAPRERPGDGEPAPTPAATTAAPAPPAPVAAAATPHPAAPAHAPATAGQPRSMDDLMAAAVTGSHPTGGTGAPASGSAGAGAAAPSAELPERPTRAQITSTMTPLTPAVRACTQGQTGMATVAMVIRNDGTVQTATVSGPFSSDANNCIAGVVRRAHFTSFTRPSVPIMYPFSIQPGHPGGT